MNAVLIRPDPRDHYPALYAGNDEMDETLAVLRADFRNLQTHVTDVKAEVRATNSRLDSLRDMIERYRVEDRERTDGKFAELGKAVDARFDKVDARFELFGKSVDASFDKVDAQFADLKGTIKWGVGLGVAGLLALIGAMVGGFQMVLNHR